MTKRNGTPDTQTNGSHPRTHTLDKIPPAPYRGPAYEPPADATSRAPAYGRLADPAYKPQASNVTVRDPLADKTPYRGPSLTGGHVIYQSSRRWAPKENEKQRINQRNFFINRMVVLSELRGYNFVIAHRRVDGWEDAVAEATREMQDAGAPPPDMSPGWVLLEECKPYGK